MINEEPPIEICAWCNQEIPFGLSHLPKITKGKCAIIGKEFAKRTDMHPVAMYASEELGLLANKANRIIIEIVKAKFGDKIDAATLVLNWNVGIINFVSILLQRTLEIQFDAASISFIEEQMKKVHQN